MPGSTISSTITSQVTLGYGIALGALTITNKGDIADAGGYGILVGSAYDGTIVNAGSIIGRTDGVYASGYAVTLFNSGTIFGDRAGVWLYNSVGGPNVVVNAAAISGNAGIEGADVSITNTGIIKGVDFGIRVDFSEIVNSGTITGQTGLRSQESTLKNTGIIIGSQTGLYVSGGAASNFGSIAGGVGVRITNDGGDASLSNAGSISGGVIVSGGTLVNAARISGVTAVSLGVASHATNTGTIYGQFYGVAINGPANSDSFVNAGSIYAQNDGVLISGGYLANSGSIAGGNVGITISGGLMVNSGAVSSRNVAVALSGGSVANYGSIYGRSDGIAVSGGSVINSGAILGGQEGVELVGGSLENYGVVSGAVYGVADFGGSVVNYGTISSANIGVMVSRDRLTNAGTIAGRVHAVYGAFITLAVDPGAVFAGDVVNNNGEGFLDLQGVRPGTLSGIGSSITGFNNISFGSGADWTIAGNLAGLAMGETIVGMSRLDTIVLDGFVAASSSFVSGAGLELSDGVTAVTLDITGNFSAGGLLVTASDIGTVITDVTCYVEGTRIATAFGKIAVEKLKVGDLVCTLHAGDRAIKWIGWRRYEGRLIRDNLAALPICIKRNAIADGVPERDLLVSPGHAIAIDNVLVHASRLVNGVSVVQVTEVENVTYYHIELESHEVIFAENCPAESFQDEYFRTQFANADEYRRIYPDQAAPALMCLPRLDSGFQLHAIQSRVAARAGIAETRVTGRMQGFVDQCQGNRCFGWAQDVARPEVPVCLDIFCGARLIGRVLANIYRADVQKAGMGSGYQGFEFELPTGLGGAIEVRRTVDGKVLELAGAAVRYAA